MREDLQEVLSLRSELYRFSADERLQTDDLLPEEVADEITKLLKNFL